MKFPRRPDGLRCACAIVLGLFTSGQALGQLDEDKVMLLYNSQDEESAAIAARYLEFHPNVIPCDLNITYSAPADYPNCGITNRYITPCRFKTLFLDGPSPFVGCLEQNPEILAIATTRGLPAAISDTLTPNAQPSCIPPGQNVPTQPCNEIYASFEAALSRLGLGNLGEGPLDTAYDLVDNPYFALDYPFLEVPPFSDFLIQTCDPTDPDSLCPGDMFLVSRLDSDTADKDYDGDGDTDNVDGVIRMLVESQNPTVNKYATSAIFDTSPSSPLNFDPDEYLGAAIALWNDQWCYYYEDTDDFIHGPDDPNAVPDVTHVGFTRWPFVAMQTWGRWHGGPWGPDYAPYVGYYDAHRVGVFLSKESFNGWWIHSGGGGYPANQGQVLEWISAGGGFTVGYLQEPLTSNLVGPHPLFKNFYVYGLSWGEAVTASLSTLGMFATPIGDPIVQIIAYNPDITGDRVVDQADLDIVEAQTGQQGPDLEGDINHDGIVNKADWLLVLEAFGRNSTVPPTEPFPGYGCGDMNGDGWVLQDDLDFYHAECWAVGGPEVPCPLLDCTPLSGCPCECDLNGDALINADDEAILLDHLGTYLFDLDGNGCFDANDLNVFLAFDFACSGDPTYNPAGDFNCDGCVNAADLTKILSHVGNPPCNP